MHIGIVIPMLKEVDDHNDIDNDFKSEISFVDSHTPSQVVLAREATTPLEEERLQVMSLKNQAIA